MIYMISTASSPHPWVRDLATSATVYLNSIGSRSYHSSSWGPTFHMTKGLGEPIIKSFNERPRCQEPIVSAFSCPRSDSPRKNKEQTPAWLGWVAVRDRQLLITADLSIFERSRISRNFSMSLQLVVGENNVLSNLLTIGPRWQVRQWWFIRPLRVWIWNQALEQRKNLHPSLIGLTCLKTSVLVISTARVSKVCLCEGFF